MKKFFSVLIAAVMLLTAAAFADESILVVNGSATVSMDADRVSASIGLKIVGEDLGELQNRANDTLADIYEALQQAGLDRKDVSTSYIYMSPRYDYSGDTEEIIGYSVQHSLNITTGETDKIGQYIDAAFAAGANMMDSISFGASDDTEAARKALELAVQEAGRKAETIAAASGHSLGRILEIRENGGAESYYEAYSGGARFTMMESADSTSGTTVRASKVSVTSNVQITYELK